MNKDGVFKNPVATVDIIIELSRNVAGPKQHIILIERKNPPHGIALPGGFVDEWEYLWHAAEREAKEEVSLDVELKEQFYVYSGPKRDARLSAVSTVFIAYANKIPQAADDAKAVMIMNLDEVEEMIKQDKFVFDHGNILADYLHYIKTGERPGPKR